ncbi:hypothetical protein [Nocardia sp. NPDC020380]|uniref:hypothetical protein n=1 Tax=Nocardia sp. NPDC020380 TaxID=3364309 RepID=UPI0037BC7D80
MATISLLGPNTGRHVKVLVPEPEPRRRVQWKGRARAAVFIGVCLAAALALALFLTTPSGRSAKPKPVMPEITEMSSAFPGLVPETGSAGTGFQGSTCQSADHETADFKPREAFSGWVAAWYCTYSRGHDVQEFQLLAFRSAASARWAASQVRPFASSAEDPGFTETCGGKPYSNYRFDGPPDKPSMIFATSFFDDPRREAVLLYIHGESATPAGVVNWWKSLPLS